MKIIIKWSNWRQNYKFIICYLWSAFNWIPDSCFSRVVRPFSENWWKHQSVTMYESLSQMLGNTFRMHRWSDLTSSCGGGRGKTHRCMKGHLVSTSQTEAASLVAQTVKISACNVEDLGSMPGLRRSPGEGNGYPLQFSGLENSMDRRAWQATVRGIAKRRTQLSMRAHRENRE